MFLYRDTPILYWRTPIIPVLEKSIQVLHAVAAGSAQASMNRLARDLKIAPATCYRILQTLERADWIRPRPAGGFELAPGLTAMLHPLGDTQRLADRLGPLLDRLADATELAVKLSVRQADQAVTAYRAESPRAMALVGRAGARFPLPLGSSGAVLCSDLPAVALDKLIAAAPKSVWKNQTPADFRARIEQCRQPRLCVDRGSFHPQVHTLSGPVFGLQGEVLAAITLIGLPDDLPDSALPRLRRALIKTLNQCQQAIAKASRTP
jgi:DNA-binding IclR family transcriptional regulator